MIATSIQIVFSNYDAVLAVDAFTAIQTDAAGAFDKLQEYQQTTADWIFGYLPMISKMMWKTCIRKILTRLDFPDLFFFQPKKIFLLKGNELELQYLGMVDDEMEEDLEQIFQKRDFEKRFFSKAGSALQMKPRISKEELPA